MFKIYIVYLRINIKDMPSDLKNMLMIRLLEIGNKFDKLQMDMMKTEFGKIIPSNLSKIEMSAGYSTSVNQASFEFKISYALNPEGITRESTFSEVVERIFNLNGEINLDSLEYALNQIENQGSIEEYLCDASPALYFPEMQNSICFRFIIQKGKSNIAAA